MDSTPLPRPSSMTPHRRTTAVDSKMAADSEKADTTNGPSSSLLLTCSICHSQLQNPHMLPCLHVFCLGCLRDECQGKSLDKYFCPSCVLDDTLQAETQKSFPARIWHSFERVLEEEEEAGKEQRLQSRLAGIPTVFENDITGSATGTGTTTPSPTATSTEPWDKDINETSDNGESSAKALEPPLLVPCTMHQDRLADTFCLKCEQLACHKCVSSFHRRCQNFSGLQDAVGVKRRQFDAVHDKMAANLVTCEDVEDFQQKRLQEIDRMRTDILVQIKKFRTDIVNAILDKEKTLTQEANRLFGALHEEASRKNESAGKMAESLRKQMELLDVSFSVKGEAELLPFLPGLITRVDNDSKTVGKQYSDAVTTIVFNPDEACKAAVDASALGKVFAQGSPTNPQTGNDVAAESSKPDLDLALVTSFHGGCRDDVTEPLLTDLILLANGDVILTDRDNKCVKKFNQTGKLLTRVLLDAVPSRIASVSHARAVVSVMNKKALYFLSLFGTVRVLNTVRVKKLYSFLTSLGNGLLAAGTNLCESIDILSERGETIRSIFTQKSDKASISRPLYLAPTAPRSSIILDVKDKNAASNNITNNNTYSNGTGTSNDVSNGGSDNVDGSSNASRRASLNHNNNNHHNNNKNNNINDKSNNTDVDQSTNHSSSNKTSNFPRKLSICNNISSKKLNSNSKNKSISTSSYNQTIPSTSSSSSLPPASITTTLASAAPSKTASPPSSSSSSTTDDDILVSDSGKRVMFRLRQEGSVAFTLRPSDQIKLECPLGVAVHERGLTLLVDRDSDCVLLLDSNGNFLKKILNPQQGGVVKPCGIYAGMKGGVALSQVDGTVKIFKAV